MQLRRISPESLATDWYSRWISKNILNDLIRKKCLSGGHRCRWLRCTTVRSCWAHDYCIMGFFKERVKKEACEACVHTGSHTHWNTHMLGCRTSRTFFHNFISVFLTCWKMHVRDERDRESTFCVKNAFESKAADHMSQIIWVFFKVSHFCIKFLPCVSPDCVSLMSRKWQ